MKTYIKGNFRKSIFTSDKGYIIGLFKVRETNCEMIKDSVNKTITFTGYFHELNEDDTYIFYGEEVYLLEYYLSELQKKVVGDMMPEFNLTVINKEPEFNELADVVESYPAMNDRRLVIVRDFDVISASADFSEKAEKLFSDMPEHCVLVFVYSNIEYKPDKRRNEGGREG